MERVSYLSADGDMMITMVAFEGNTMSGQVPMPMPMPGQVPMPMPGQPHIPTAHYPTPGMPHHPGAPLQPGYPMQPGVPVVGYPAGGYPPGHHHNLSPKSAVSYSFLLLH